MRKFGTAAMFFVFTAFLVAFFAACSDKDDGTLRTPAEATAEVTANLIEISWNRVNRAVKYNLYVSQGEFIGTQEFFELMATVADTFFIGLASDRVMLQRFMVSAVDAQGNESARTAPFSAPCVQLTSAVTDLTAVAVQTGVSFGVRLFASRVEGAGFYVVHYSTSQISQTGAAVAAQQGETPAPVKRIAVYSDALSSSGFVVSGDNLDAEKTYFFRVQSMSECGTGTFSNQASATVGCLGPDAPANLRATTRGSQSITVNWDAVDGADEYVLQWGAVAVSNDNINYSVDFNNRIIVSNPTHTVATNAATTLAFRVSSRNDCGPGLLSDTVIATSGCISAPAVDQALDPVAVGISQTGIQVSWGAHSDRSVTGYQVFRSTTQNGVFTRIATVQGRENTVFVNSELSVGAVFFYRVVAFNSCGVGNVASVATDQTAEGRTLVARFDGAELPELAGLAARLDESNNTIRISWTRHANADNYEIQRSTIEEATDTDWTNIGTTRELRFDDVNLAPNTKYFYRVRATNLHGQESAFSSPVNASTRCLIPAAVTISSDRLAENRIMISWNAVANANSYEIFRAAGSNATVFTSQGTVSATEFIQVVEPTVTYQYYVIAKNSCASGPRSDIVSRRAGNDCTQLTANSASGSATSESSIMVSWPSTPGAIGYNVYRSTVNTAATAVRVAINIRGNTWEDVGTQEAPLDRRTPYFYFITAINECGAEGPRGASASETVICRTPADMDGGSIGFTVNENRTQIRLTWATSTGATSYKIERFLASQDHVFPILGQDEVWTTVAANHRHTIGYTDTNLDTNAIYWYKITPLNDICTSNDEPVAGRPVFGQVRTIAVPAVTGLEVITDSTTTNRVLLRWDRVNNDDVNVVVSYRLIRVNTETGESTLAGSLIPQPPSGAEKVESRISGLIPGTQYTFTVQAWFTVGGTIQGPVSNPVTETTVAFPQVTNLRLTTDTDNEVVRTNNSVSLTWDIVASNPPAMTVSGYRVRVINGRTGALVAGSDFSIDQPTAGTTVTYEVGGLERETPYRFLVWINGADNLGVVHASIVASTSSSAIPAVTGLRVTTTGEGDALQQVRTASSISLTWDRATGTDITGYIVRVINVETGLQQGIDRTVQQLAEGENVTSNVTGLAPGTQYRFTVFARNTNNGITGIIPSNVVIGTTRTIPQVTGLRVTTAGDPAEPVRTESSVSLTWNRAAAENVSDYVVRVFNVATGLQVGGNNIVAAQPAEGETVTLNVTGLPAGTQYRFVVFAREGGTVGLTPSEAVTQATLAIPAITGLAVGNRTDNSITLTWNRAAASIVAGYDIRVVRVSDGAVSWHQQTQPAEGNVSFPVPSLLSGTQYSFYVSARSTSGNTGVEANVSASTTGSAPTVPAVPTWSFGSPVTMRSIPVTISSVTGATGYIVHIENGATNATVYVSTFFNAAEILPPVEGNSFFVWVSAENDVGQSDWCNGKSLVMCGTPEVTGLTHSFADYGGTVNDRLNITVAFSGTTLADGLEVEIEDSGTWRNMTVNNVNFVGNTVSAYLLGLDLWDSGDINVSIRVTNSCGNWSEIFTGTVEKP